MNSSEALTFKNVSVTSSEGLAQSTAADAVVVQPGTGVVVFIQGEPRFVLRQDEGLDVFPARTDNKELSIVSGSSVVKLQFLSDGNAKSFRQAVESRNQRADLRGNLRSSLAAEASMSKASTAMTAASREDDYSRRNLANELSQRRDRHRSLAQKFNSGVDAESFLIRERFSTAAERSRQRLDQVESRHIERLEAALLAAGHGGANNNNSSNNNNGDRQRLWDAWAEAEAYRDQDIHRVGVQNKRDNSNVVQWQQTQRRREQIFNELQGELRHFDNVQSAAPFSSPSNTNHPLSPQSMRLVEQVRSLLNVHQDDVSQARANGASLAEQQIIEERASQQEFLRLEQERRAREERERQEDEVRQREAQEEARKRWEEEQKEIERKKMESQKPIRMMGDWKELKHPETNHTYFLNVVTQKVTFRVEDTPFYVPTPVVVENKPDPVLAKQNTAAVKQEPTAKPVEQQPKPVATEKTKPQTSSSSSSPQPGEVNGDWKAMLDKASSKTYFFNTATKKTTWKIEETTFNKGSKPAATTSSSSSSVPQVGEVKGDWKVMLDKASGKNYFFNTATKKTTWKIEDTSFAASSAASPTTATAAGSSSSAPQVGEVKGDWKVMKDKASGKLYYFNSSTKKTTWKVEDTPFATGAAASSSSPTAAATSSSASQPAVGETNGDWKVMLDKAKNKQYYYNKTTKKTTWNIEDTPFAAGGTSSSKPAATTTTTSSGALKTGDVRGDWKVMLDKTSGKNYFYNASTKKTTWKQNETSFAENIDDVLSNFL